MIYMKAITHLTRGLSYSGRVNQHHAQKTAKNGTRICQCLSLSCILLQLLWCQVCCHTFSGIIDA